MRRPESSCDPRDRDEERPQTDDLRERGEAIAAREQHRREDADLGARRVRVQARVARVRHVGDRLLLLPERRSREVVGERVPLEGGRQEGEAEDVDAAHADDDGEGRDERLRSSASSARTAGRSDGGRGRPRTCQTSATSPVEAASPRTSPARVTSSNGESSSATTTTCAHAMTYAVSRSSAAVRAPRHAAPSAPVAASAASASTRRPIPRAPVSGLHGTGHDGRRSRGAGYDPAVRELTIEGRRIADDTPCFVIAEIGHNHQGSVEQAKELFRAARERAWTRSSSRSATTPPLHPGALRQPVRQREQLRRRRTASIARRSSSIGTRTPSCATSPPSSVSCSSRPRSTRRAPTSWGAGPAGLQDRLRRPAQHAAPPSRRGARQADDRLDRRSDPRGRRPRDGDDHADQRPGSASSSARPPTRRRWRS